MEDRINCVHKLVTFHVYCWGVKSFADYSTYVMFLARNCGNPDKEALPGSANVEPFIEAHGGSFLLKGVAFLHAPIL